MPAKVPDVKSRKVYAVVESVVESCPPEQLHAFLKEGKFKGEVEVHMNQGGVINTTTKEKILLTMAELDSILATREKK